MRKMLLTFVDDLYEDLELLRKQLQGDLSDDEARRRMSATSVTYGEPFEVDPEDLDVAEKFGKGNRCRGGSCGAQHEKGRHREHDDEHTCSDPEQAGPWKFASEHRYPLDAGSGDRLVSVDLGGGAMILSDHRGTVNSDLAWIYRARR